MPPPLSVVMPVYNGERFLRQAIDSVLAQTEPGYEPVVVDDGSTDGTPGILASYDDPRVRPVRRFPARPDRPTRFGRPGARTRRATPAAKGGGTPGGRGPRAGGCWGRRDRAVPRVAGGLIRGWGGVGGAAYRSGQYERGRA